MIRTTLMAAVCLGMAGGLVQAQMVCGDREAVEQNLKRQFREERSGYGITNAGSLVVVYTSKKGETWTLATISPDGRLCLIGAGKDWHWPQRGTPIKVTR